MRPEAQLAYLCAIAPPAARAAEMLQQLLSQGTHAAFAETLQRNQLHPEAGALLSLLPTPGAAQLARGVHERARLLEAQSKMQAAEMAALLARLEDQGIVALAFKGPAFASYAGRGLTRESDDLDVIVARGDLVAAVACLAGAGYRSTLALSAAQLPLLADVAHELQLLDERGALLVEVHWRLAPPFHPATLVEAEIFEGLGRLPFLGRPIAWPGPERLLLMHVADGMKSGGLGARWLGDLAAILRREPALDWALVREVARKGEGVNSLRVSMAALRSVCRATDSMREATGIDRWFPDGAQRLSLEAMRSPRLAAAVSRIVGTAAGGTRHVRPLRHFWWSLTVSDRRMATLRRIASYVAGPAVADLAAGAACAATPALRLKSLGRRMRGLTRPAGSRA